jgi:hypothetical protein
MYKKTRPINQYTHVFFLQLGRATMLLWLLLSRRA